MKKHLLIGFSLFVFQANLHAQTCPELANWYDWVSFSTQEQVDNFAILYPECTELYNVSIYGDDITNLQGLHAIESIWTLRIQHTDLTSLIGLEGLDSVRSLNFYMNHRLKDLTGLESLRKIGTPTNGQVFINYNDSLQSLNGLENLTTFYAELWITHNPLLTSISGLSGVTSIGNDVTILENSIQSLDGLQNVTAINGDLTIMYSPDLVDISGLSSLVSVEDNFIIQYTSIESLDGLENLTTVGGSFDVRWNPPLADISSLDHAMTIGGQLIIRHHPMLEECIVQGVCDYPGYTSDFSGFQVYQNKGFCQYLHEVVAACGTVPTTEVLAEAIQISPNPTSNIVVVSAGDLRIDKIEIRDAMGKIVWQQKAPRSLSVDLGQLPAGVYVMAIQIENQSVIRKVVKI